MWSAFISLLIVILVIVLAVVLSSAVLLALGTLLTLLFAVSVFEATAIVLVVTAAVLWLAFGSRLNPDAGSLAFEEGDEEEPRVVVTSLPLPSMRRGKKRRR